MEHLLAYELDNKAEQRARQSNDERVLRAHLNQSYLARIVNAASVAVAIETANRLAMTPHPLFLLIVFIIIIVAAWAFESHITVMLEIRTTILKPVWRWIRRIVQTVSSYVLYIHFGIISQMFASSMSDVTSWITVVLKVFIVVVMTLGVLELLSTRFYENDIDAVDAIGDSESERHVE